MDVALTRTVGQLGTEAQQGRLICPNTYRPENPMAAINAFQYHDAITLVRLLRSSG